MSLDLDVRLALGDLDLRVELVAPAGAVTAVLGPNGAGKTTFLRVVAGGLAVDAGHVRLGGVVLDEPPRTFVPPERRRIGVVHQDHLLFPHLSALDNVAFGPRCQGRTAADARRTAADLLDRFGLAALGETRPRALSGGQAQRVALARALASDPAALLLDEPLAALDAGTRVEVRRDLHRWLRGLAGPTVLVTHDPVDALALADHVVVLEQGTVTQAGPLADVTARPRSRYVADLIGTNLLRGTATGTVLTTDDGDHVTLADSHHGPVLATVAPSAVALHVREPEGSARNRWPATVRHLDLLGDRVRVQLDGPANLVAEITPAALAELDLHEGDPVWVSVKATEVVAYPS